MSPNLVTSIPPNLPKYFSKIESFLGFPQSEGIHLAVLEELWSQDLVTEMDGRTDGQRVNKY